MNIDQLSIQITAINDAIQILARSETTVQQHTKEIDGLLAKTSKNDERIRDIESLIHQSCELKSKEIQEHKDKLHTAISEGMDASNTFTKYVAAALAGSGILVTTWLYNNVETKSAEHTAFEERQEAKSEKIFQEIFGVMRDIRTDISLIKADLAVIQNEQKHYQNKLHNHMLVEEGKH